MYPSGHCLGYSGVQSLAVYLHLSDTACIHNDLKHTLREVLRRRGNFHQNITFIIVKFSEVIFESGNVLTF